MEPVLGNVRRDHWQFDDLVTKRLGVGNVRPVNGYA
jgi:hypothetical protein